MLMAMQEKGEISFQQSPDMGILFGDQPVSRMVYQGDRKVVSGHLLEERLQLESPCHPEPAQFLAARAARRPGRVEPGDADTQSGHFSGVGVDQVVAAGQQMVVPVGVQETRVVVQPCEEPLPIGSCLLGGRFDFVQRVGLGQPAVSNVVIRSRLTS